MNFFSSLIKELLLTLPVEFLAHPLAPLSAQLPNPTGVADVCALESDLMANTGIQRLEFCGKQVLKGRSVCVCVVVGGWWCT